MTNKHQAKSSSTCHVRTLRRGEWVEVRSPDEIQSTLDAEGKLDGMPFMPEMLKYCGRTFRVSHRADRIFLDRYWYVAKLKDTVFLEEEKVTGPICAKHSSSRSGKLDLSPFSSNGLRCDGQAHEGCQMRCELFWKEAWLKPADPSSEPETIPTAQGLISLNLPTRKGERFTCQATELVHASSRLPWWDPRQYVREVMLGETTISELIIDLLRRGRQKFLRMLHRQNKLAENPLTQPTPTECLNLQAGEWVEVKKLSEIQATLDADGRNRGLGFAPDQAEFCGKRLRVAGRVEKLILEWSGELRPITNTVELEEATCHGRMCRSCPRNCYHLWREIWLSRAPSPE